MEKAILLLSGGLDSATLLWQLKGSYVIYALTMRYGRTNKMEVRSSRALARRAGVEEHMVVDLGVLQELDEYEPGRAAPLGLPACYIPAMNAIQFGIAAHYAELRGASFVFTGQNKDDRFPDSGQEFIESFNRIIAMGRPPRLKLDTRVSAPLIDMKKSEILRMARRLHVPLELVWSCHRDGPSPCGSCAGCLALSDAIRECG